MLKEINKDQFDSVNNATRSGYRQEVIDTIKKEIQSKNLRNKWLEFQLKETMNVSTKAYLIKQLVGTGVLKELKITDLKKINVNDKQVNHFGKILMRV